MSFHLNITIGGLCMLVRETNPSPKLHILMPEDSGVSHFPRLAYRKIHEVSGSPAIDVEKIPLSMADVLDLSDLTSTNAFSTVLPSDVFDFGTTPLGPRSVKPDANLPSLHFRTALTAGAQVDHRPGGKFFVTDPNGIETSVRMATSIEWKLENVGGPKVKNGKLFLHIGGTDRILSPLPGTDGHPMIHLLLLHVTQPELDALTDPLSTATKFPPDRDPAHHFTSYYPLLNPTDPQVTPEYDQSGTEGFLPQVPVHPTISSAFNFGSELTCMLTTGPRP